MGQHVSSAKCTVALTPRFLRVPSGDPYETTSTGIFSQNYVLQCSYLANLGTSCDLNYGVERLLSMMIGLLVVMELLLIPTGSTERSRENLIRDCSAGRSIGGGPELTRFQAQTWRSTPHYGLFCIKVSHRA